MSDTPAPARRRGRPGYDQQQVYLRAVELFNQVGYDRTSIGMLADHLGLSKSAIYHHVESKDDLLRQALGEALSALESILESAESLAQTDADVLESVIRRTVLVLVDKLPFVTLLLRLRGNSPVEQEALARRRAFDERLGRLVQTVQHAGGLRDDIDPGTITRLIFGTINSVTEWYRPDGHVTPGQLADDVVTMVFHGLGTSRHGTS